MASTKRSSSKYVSPSPSALASFHAVLGLTGFPRRVDFRVGYEIPAQRAKCVRLHPRRAQAAFRCAGTTITTRPPGPSRYGVLESICDSEPPREGWLDSRADVPTRTTDSRAAEPDAPPVPPGPLPQRPGQAMSGLSGSNGSVMDETQDENGAGPDWA